MATVGTAGRRRSLSRILRNAAALASAGSAAIHFAIAADHLAAAPVEGMALVAAAWFQLAWALVVTARPTPTVYRVGGVGNVVLILGWVVARALGDGVDGDMVAGAAVLVLETATVVACGLLLGSGARRRVPAVAVPAATVAVAILTALATVVSVASFSHAPRRGAPAGTTVGHGAPPAPPASAAEHDARREARTHRVRIADDAFEPRRLRIAPGDTVVWVNRGDGPHTASADDDSFDSGNLDPGSRFERTFDEEGRFYYFCRYHGSPRRGMWGMVIVGRGGGLVPAHSAGRTDATHRGVASLADHSVAIGDDSFSPARLSVTAGDTVTWVNRGVALHTVTADRGTFDSGEMAPGEGFSHTFATAGVFAYYCRFHGGPGGSGMAGVVVVAEPGTAPPVAATGPPAGGGGGSTAPPPASATRVAAFDDTFAPARVTIPIGTTVAWVNRSDRVHTVTAEGGSFDSGDLGPRRTFGFTFARPGTYYYFCRYHGDPRSGMWGTVVVSDRSTGGGTGAGGTGTGAGGGGAGGGDDPERDEEVAEARRRCEEEIAEAEEEGGREEIREARARCEEWMQDAREDHSGPG